MTQPIRAILLELQRDIAEMQNGVTLALNTLDGGPRPASAYERRIETARAGILGGWWQLTEAMFDVELDLLGIAHTDRAQLVTEYQRERGLRVDTNNRARETAVSGG